MKIAAAYIRVSTDDQLEYSPDSQLVQIRRYAKANGFTLPEEYIFIEEEGRSGRYSVKRPEFLRMISTAKKKPKPFDAILVWKYSRFARSRQDSIIYKSMLRKELGIEVISISENLGDDKMSIIAEAIIEAMDEFYSVNLAEEVTRGMAEKARRGQPLPYAPFGYRIENKRYLPDPDTALLVQMIYSDFLSGMGYREIAQKLDKMDVRTRFGNRMESRNIEYILKNPVYIGKIHWNPGTKMQRSVLPNSAILSDGEHPALVSLDDWNAVQKRIQELKTLYHKKAKSAVIPEHEFALRGLVRCSSCGSTLVNSGNGSLQCNAYARGRCSVSHAINREQLTQLVLSTIQTDFTESRFQLNLPKSAPIIDPFTLLQNQLEREQMKLKRIQQAYEAGVDTLEEYSCSKEKRMASIRQLQEQLEKLRFSSNPSLDDNRHYVSNQSLSLLAFLKDPDNSEKEKNILLRSLIEKVVFDRQKNSIEIYYCL